MKTNKDALQWLKLQKSKFWRITIANTKTVCGKSFEEGNEDEAEPTEQASLKLFEEITDILPAGTYVLGARKTANSYNSEVCYTFQIAGEEDTRDYQKTIAGINNAYNPQLEALEKRLQDFERKELERELEEKYKKKYQPKEEGMNKFIGTIGMLYDMWTGKKQAAGIQGTTDQEETTEEAANELEAHLVSIQSKIGTSELIRALGALSTKSPEQLKQILSFLK